MLNTVPLRSKLAAKALLASPAQPGGIASQKPANAAKPPWQPDCCHGGFILSDGRGQGRTAGRCSLHAAAGKFPAACPGRLPPILCKPSALQGCIPLCGPAQRNGRRRAHLTTQRKFFPSLPGPAKGPERRAPVWPGLCASQPAPAEHQPRQRNGKAAAQQDKERHLPNQRGHSHEQHAHHCQRRRRKQGAL